MKTSIKAPIKDIINNLSLKSLKEICQMKGLRNLSLEEVKRRKVLLEALKEQQETWSDEQRKKLIEIYTKEKQTQTNSTAHLFRSDDIQERGINEIKSKLEQNKVEVDGEKIKDGFEEVIKNGDELSTIFKGCSERISPIGGELVKEKQIISIPILIQKEHGCVLLKGNNPRHIKDCRKFVMNALEIKKLYYSVPQGIKDEGANADDYNGRARDFVTALKVEEINGVFLKLDGSTKINKVDYRGKGDILGEKEIKTKIRNGALINGLRGYLRHKGVMVEFTIRWGFFCQIGIRGTNISYELVEEILKRISAAYRENMLR